MTSSSRIVTSLDAGLRSRRLLVACCVVATLVGACRCEQPLPPEVIATHEPMHPVGVDVTLRGRATGTVDSVELKIGHHMVAPGASPPGPGPLVGSLSVVKTCNPPGSQPEVICEHAFPTSGLPVGSILKFVVTAKGAGGSSASESYFFTASTLPDPLEPIPIRYKGPQKEKLDVVLIADQGVTPISQFQDLLDEVVEDAFFAYDEVKDWRGIYNFYYTGIQGSYSEFCQFVKPANETRLGFANVKFILHQDVKQDCSTNRYASAELNESKSLLHEAGHVLFTLEDEYCNCENSYNPQASTPNIWPTSASCKSEASSIGYSQNDCTQISKTNCDICECDTADCSVPFWRIDPIGSQGCLMGESWLQSGSDFGKACRRRIFWRYNACLAGNC